MVEMTANDIILLIGAGSGAIATLIYAVQKSRCTTIDCCCIKCKRQLGSPKKSPQDREENGISPVIETIT